MRGPPILGVSITIKYLGFKHDEFRSKFSHYRGPVVIHSSKEVAHASIAGICVDALPATAAAIQMRLCKHCSRYRVR